MALGRFARMGRMAVSADTHSKSRSLLAANCATSVFVEKTVVKELLDRQWADSALSPSRERVNVVSCPGSAAKLPQFLWLDSAWGGRLSQEFGTGQCAKHIKQGSV